MKWLKNAFHYLKLIFKKSTLDNLILEHFINEIIESGIIYELEKRTGLNEVAINNLLEELLIVYNKHF